MMVVYSRALSDEGQLKVLDREFDFGHGRCTVSQG